MPPSPLLLEFIRALPKAELHLHLEGSITPERALGLATRHGVRLPGADRGLEGLRDSFRFRSFEDFIALYVALSACLQRAEDFTAIVVDLAGRLAEQNVRYAEVTFTPMTHVTRGVPEAVVRQGLLDGRAEAEAIHGVAIRWVFDVVRSFPDLAEPTLAFALRLRERDPDGVVGFGVGGPEAGDFDMPAIARAFVRAKAAGLKSLPHAGEMAGRDSLWTAVHALGADRIGHGVRCLEDPALVQALKDRGVALEVCPTSNVVLGVCPDLRAHPLPRLLEAGVPLSLGSDDPTLFGADLVDEYWRCANAFGWDADTIRRLARASIEHAFMPEKLAQALLTAQEAVVAPPTQNPVPS